MVVEIRILPCACDSCASRVRNAERAGHDGTSRGAEAIKKTEYGKRKKIEKN